MSSKIRLITLIFSLLCLLLSPAFAQKASIEVDVIGVDGGPAKGAEVWIERQGQKATPVVGKTDHRGHLKARNLDAGTYKLAARVEGGIQLSQIVKTLANKAASAVFDMRKTAAVAGKTKKNTSGFRVKLAADSVAIGSRRRAMKNLLPAHVTLRC